jgi:hypothetical protein
MVTSPRALLASTVTLDYQFIVNPAYNRDRGPISVIGARVQRSFDRKPRPAHYGSGRDADMVE